jgi:hypothetical protein
MFVRHRKHTYGPPRPIMGTALLLTSLQEERNYTEPSVGKLQRKIPVPTGDVTESESTET